LSWTQQLVDFAEAQVTDRVRESLLSRGVSPAQMEMYHIGYLNQELPSGCSPHFLEWSKDGSKLDDVFVLPLTTALGEVRGFQFRHVDRKRSGYMDYFLDRREACLFGLHQAIPHIWETRSVYLVEGGFDLFPIQRATPIVFATLTAYTNKATIRLLRRLVDRVWVGYDMDHPGRTGCKNFEKHHGSDFEVYTVTYPRIQGAMVKDPGELWEAWGDAQLVPFIRNLMAEADQFKF
jgi:DNA primase